MNITRFMQDTIGRVGVLKRKHDDMSTREGSPKWNDYEYWPKLPIS